MQPPKIEVCSSPNKRHSLAGNPSLPEITWLWEGVYYHGVIRRRAHTMVKVILNAAGTAVV